MWHFQSNPCFNTTNAALGCTNTTVMRRGESFQANNNIGGLSDGILSHSSSMSDDMDIYRYDRHLTKPVSPSSRMSSTAPQPHDLYHFQYQTYYEEQPVRLYPAHPVQSFYVDTPTLDPNNEDDNEDIWEDRVLVSDSSIVVQINGKRGARIKALIIKFGTQIKTPRLNQRHKEFVIRGKHANVLKVKEEIQNAAAHFTKLELDRQNHMHSIMGDEDSVTCKVYVPFELMGNVIGRNGVWVRQLQNTYHVYIKTPKFKNQNDAKRTEPFLVMGPQASVTIVVTRMYEHLCSRRNELLDKIFAGPNEVHFVDGDPTGQQLQQQARLSQFAKPMYTLSHYLRHIIYTRV